MNLGKSELVPVEEVSIIEVLVDILGCKKGSLPMKYLGLALGANEALLGKWLWRFGNEWDELWRRVVEVKYGRIWGGWRTNIVSGSYGVSLGKSLRQWSPVFSQ